MVLGATRTPAMARAGLRFDLAGLQVDEPDDVVVEGLAHLAHGPVWVMPGSERVVLKRSDPDRAKVVQRAHAGHMRLVGG